MSYIHIKLDKFVAGDNKRIFKSNIKTFNNNDIIKNDIAYQNINDNKEGITQIYYGNYYKQNNVTKNFFQSNLIHFNLIQPKYVKQTDKVNFKQFINISNLYNCMFESNQANINQQVNYFKSIMQMPVDIAGVQNMAYMLSPFGKRKNIQIVNPNFNIEYKDYDIKADYKDNYKKMYNYLFDRTTSNSQFNTIPLYDINLQHLDTITFQSLEKLKEFIAQYKLENMTSILFCNVNNKFEQQQIDSIKIHQFFEYAINNNIVIDKELIKKLVDNMTLDSFNNYFYQKGYISKLSNKTIETILNSQLLSSNFKNIFQIFTSQLDQIYTKNTIPNNSLYLLDTQNILDKDQNGKLSAALNFVNLKNFQTPLQDFQIDITQATSADLNKKVNDLFDNDNTKSLLYNINEQYNYYLNSINENLIPTKKVTEQILSSAIIYSNRDYNNQQLSSYFENINKNNLEEDSNHYLKPFYQYHKQINKFQQVGQLNGIRNYLNIGILDEQDNIWLSYKYITNKNEKLINLFTSTYQLPFKPYEISRQTDHMQFDYQGILYKGEQNPRITKKENQICPYVNYNIELSSILCKNCKKIKQNNYTGKCQGYCPFPTNNQYYENKKYDLPHLVWSNSKYMQYNVTKSNELFTDLNDQWFYFVLDDTNNKCVLKAQTDIEVNDDIQIYYSNMPFKNFTNYIKSNKHKYESIVEGFSKKYSILHNKDINIKQIYKSVQIKNCFKTIQQYTKQFIQINPTKKLGQLFNRKLKEFIDIQYIKNLPKAIDRSIFQQNLYVLLYNDNDINNILYLTYKQIISGIKIIDSGILKGMSTFKLYYTNLYELIKNIKLTQNLTLQQLPTVKIKNTEKILYKDFVIAQDTPFNGPHVIPAGTKLEALLIYQNSKDKSIQITKIKDYLKIEKDKNENKLQTMYCYIRVINWWSNVIKCTGKIKIQYMDSDIINRETYKIINNIINNYDHIQKIDGFFKSLQSDYKKSNIYSIRVKNSSFDKKLDIDIFDYHEYILLRNYAYLDKNTQKMYKLITPEQLLNKQTKTLAQTQNFENSILYKLYISNLPGSNLNIVQSFNNFYDIDKMQGNLTANKISMSKMFIYIKNQGGIYQLDKEYVNKLIKAKNDLRNIFEQAIINSVHKYMPAHTDLWKIIYEN